MPSTVQRSFAIHYVQRKSVWCLLKTAFLELYIFNCEWQNIVQASEKKMWEKILSLVSQRGADT